MASLKPLGQRGVSAMITPPERHRHQLVAEATTRSRNWAEHIRLIAEGDDASLDRLYEESGPMLYRLALRMLGNTADAEEIVLDVFSHVWRCSGTWNAKRGTAPAWLMMLCRSRCQDRLRARRCHTVFPLNRSVDQIRHLSPVPRIEHEHLREALDRIAPDHRKLLHLAFFSGFTHTELARHLRLPLGTVKTRIRAAIMEMRDLLFPHV